MVLTVLCIMSMASSIDWIRSLMSPRSKGVMKLRRTASSTSRGDIVGLVFKLDDPLAIADRSPRPGEAFERVGGTDDGAGMVREEIEKAVFAGKEFPEPSQHIDLPSRQSRPIHSHNAAASHWKQ